MEIKPLDPHQIHMANYNSFNGNRGDLSNASYLAYGQEVLEWPIADSKKEKLLVELHKRYSVILNYEAQHVSVMVAGPSKYNARKLDKGDQVLRSSAEFCTWFDGIREQVKDSLPEVMSKVDLLVESIERRDAVDTLIPTNPLMELAYQDNALFIQYYEKLRDKYKWRKNTNIHKLYVKSLAGEIHEIKKEIVFEDDNLTAYKEGDRYYIKFVLRVKRQLHVALKSRGWWWNSYERAYSTYLDRFDLEWVQSISVRYSNYI